jgi:hypothetical protein
MNRGMASKEGRLGDSPGHDLSCPYKLGACGLFWRTAEIVGEAEAIV